MIRKSLYFIIALAGLLIAGFYLQPIKKGKGLDTTVKYEMVKNWPQLPINIKLGNPVGIGIDTNQNIIVLHRAGRDWHLFGPMPDKLIRSNTILIIDNVTGKLINSWGGDLFIMPHGLTVDYENNIWITDVGRHQIFKFSHEGKLLLNLGEDKVPGKGPMHFDKPTDIAVAKDGSFYVSDGYGNNRIVKFSKEGEYLFEWGTKGRKEGEFNIPHGISLDSDENVYVADRENNRIQIFDFSGKFIAEITDKSFGTISSVAFDKTQSKLFAVDDFTFLKIKHRGSDLLIFDKKGKVQTRFGRSGHYPGNISWYHDLAVDKNENIYIGDILGNTIQKFQEVPDQR